MFRRWVALLDMPEREGTSPKEVLVLLFTSSIAGRGRDQCLQTVDESEADTLVVVAALELEGRAIQQL
jgi:hypothetical protein